ncbi:DUF1772 domain-containing protein [Ilumatobacter sp.]|uniref:anthrone oxygenase family protein n=1 Tax=Ilumatobacter sp. TaxID=1967498 RepID=UPI003AF7E8F0
MDLKTALLAGGIVTTGLMSGLLYGWSVSVIPGTRRVSAGNYVDTMQHINRAIVNPAFIIPFMGIPLVLGGAAIMQFRSGDHRRGWLLAGATATYVVGVLGVTIGRNVPLNDALDAFDLRGSADDAIERRRSSYEAPWNRWHYLRTIASVGSFALAAAAALVATDDG